MSYTYIKYYRIKNSISFVPHFRKNFLLYKKRRLNLNFLKKVENCKSVVRLKVTFILTYELLFDTSFT